MRSTYAEAARGLKQELKSYFDVETLRKLNTRRPVWHLLIVLRQFMLLGISQWALWNYSSPFIAAPAVFVSGFTLFNFTVLLHEELHGLIFQKPHPNASAFLGHLYAFFCGVSRTQFTKWHLDHHAHLGSDTLDPKRHHLSPKINSRLIKLLYFTPVLFPIYFRAAARESASYTEPLKKSIRLERTLIVAGHLAIQALLLFAGSPAVWFRAYIFPVVLIFPIAFAMNRLGQHYAIKVDDPAGWSTLVRGHFFWDFAFLNSNYHLEHHYYPGVPFYYLPKLQEELLPFYEKHELKPYGYAKLFYGYIILNRAPHTEW